MRSTWSRFWRSSPRAIRKKLRLKGQLRLERLEDRLALSTTVSLDVAGNLLISDTGTTSNDNITVKSDTTNNQFVISDPANTINTSIAGATGDGTNTVLVPFSSVTGSAIVVDTLSGDDVLSVDLGSGNFAKTITYNGGSQGLSGDELQLLGGGTFANVSHTFSSASAGSVAISGNGLITYSGLEPVTDNLSATDRIFSFTGGAETVVLADVVGAPYMSIDSTLGEIVHFLSPTNSLTIDAGLGNDTININSVDASFAASLIIHGGTGNDTVNLNSDITFAADRNLEINLQDDAAVVGADVITVQANANYSLSGTGTATLKASSGIAFASGSSLTTVDGDLILEGNGPGIADSSFTGVTVDRATVQSIGSGAVKVLGRGGVGGSNNHGVRLMGTAVIKSGSGPLQVLGTGGTSTGSHNTGVSLEGAGALITSAGGDVQVTGVGGGGGLSFGNIGVLLRSAQITAGGTGSVIVHGTGSTTSGGPNRGVELSASIISSSGGNVQVTGIGGALPQSATNGNNSGVVVQLASQITAGGTGTVTVHGTGSLVGGVSNHGVSVNGSNSLITSNGGDIQITGIRGAESSTTRSYGITLFGDGRVVAGGAANIELISDSMDISSIVDGGLNAVTVRQLTNGTSITLNAADSAGVLGLTDPELDRITAATINIGDSNTGTLTVLSTVSRSAPALMNLTTGSNIALNGVLLDSGEVVNLNAPAGSITTQPGSGASAPHVRAITVNVDGIVAPGGSSVSAFAVDGSVVLSSSDRFRTHLNGSAPINQHDLIFASGTASLGGATLEVLPGFTPSIGQLFTIVNTMDGVNGTFKDPDGNTLNEGDTFNVNGITFSITYTGGADGRDVVLQAQTSGPTISISDESVVETNAGTTTITFNITLSAPSNETVSVNWATANGTATTADDDYVEANGTVTFGVGETSKQVTITVSGDLKFEPNETFAVNLSDAVGATIGDGQGIGTVLNDDSGPTSSINDVTGVEGTFSSNNFVFTVSLSNPTADTVVIDYQVFDGTAQAAADYFGNSSGSLTFAPGETEKSITIGINTDDRFELDESFTVKIFTGSDSPASDDTGIGTILNDDNQPTISINDLSVVEGNSGTKILTVPVLLSNPSYLPITVDFATADNTATVFDNDYQPVTGTVTFNPGQTIQTFTVLVNGDNKFEPNENFTVNLSNATNATIADAVAVNTIVNDDERPTISIDDISMLEGNSGIASHVFTVTLSNPSSESVSVNFATGDGTALSNDNDYEPRIGSLTISPGQMSQSISVLILGDTKFEPDETFTLTLTDPVNATLADASGQGTILNDDTQKKLTLSIAKDWSFQTVDSAGDVGAWSSLEIGSDNNPRIAYEDRTTLSRNLKYASFDGAAWNVETVHDDATDIVGQGARLTLDSSNRPHIAYQNFSETDLLYAHHNGTSWLLETANVNSYLHLSIDVDSQDRPLVSSFNHNTFDLNLARRENGTWSVEAPDASNDSTGFYTSLVVDSADNPWITFVNGTDKTLTLARHDGTAWQFETIDSDSDFRDTSLALDSLGRPHVSYYDFGASGSKRDLKYAFFDGSDWIITTVDANNAGEHNSLVLDSLDRPRIAYIGSGAARFASFDGTGWTTQFVGAQANYTSLALDENDLASISYYSTVTQDLVLASQVPASMSENGGSRLATVTRTDTTGALTVNLLSNDTTEATVVAEIVLADGQATSAPFTIDAVDDAIVDGTQIVTISASANDYLGDSDTILVTDDDTDNPPTVTLSFAGNPLAENGGVAIVTATLSSTFNQPVTVDLGFTGTAMHPTDYSRSATSIVIPAGSTSGDITLTAIDDPTDEADETIVVDIVGVTNGTESGTQQVTATIIDDDATPSVSIDDVTATEGNLGTKSFVFNVTLSNPSSQTITVNYTTENGTATVLDDDYENNSGTITFAPGQTSSSVEIIVNGDGKFEQDETFTIVLGGAANATIADGSGLGTILNDDDQPTISIGNASLLEGDSGATAFAFTVSLSNPSEQPITVEFSTVDDSATVADSDYQAASGTVTFSPGQTSQSINVLVNGDTKFESDETFSVNLSAATNATIADGSGLGTILNDDNQPTISINDVSQQEGDAGTTDFAFTVSLSNPSSQPVTVNFTLINGSATIADSDYQAASGTVTFAPGQTSQSINVLVNGDTKFESDETFSVNLSAATNATIADGSGLGTILNDDNQPTISIDDVSLQEGDSGASAFVFTVSLSNPSEQPITVEFSAVDGSATIADADYQAASGTVTFAPGQTSQSINVPVNGDTKFESDETFSVNLSAATNATIADGSGLGTILNDDSQPTISINNVSLPEGNAGTKNFVFTASLSNPSSQPITVDFAVVDGSATAADSDYQASSGTVTFVPGQTSQSITVLVNGDTQDESEEMFFVTLSNSVNAAVADGQGAGVIVNDDAQDRDGRIELVDGVLTIHGTDDADRVHINRVGSGKKAEIKVHASFLQGKPHVNFDESSISRIVILLYAGDDEATTAGNVTLEMTMDGGTGDDVLQSGAGNSLLRGGAGEDTLRGGSGNDILVGGDGDDSLTGGQDGDLLIGGAGLDSITGNDGDDILIAGFTDHDANDAALLDIMKEWHSGHTFVQRVNNLRNGTGGGTGGPKNGTTFLNESTVHDDGVKDVLTGNGGTDWFLYNFSGAGVKDSVKDENSSEGLVRLDI